MHILVETIFISFSFYSLSNVTSEYKIIDKFVCDVLESLFIYHKRIYLDIHMPNFRGLEAGAVGKISIFGFSTVNFEFLDAFFPLKIILYMF